MTEEGEIAEIVKETPPIDIPNAEEITPIVIKLQTWWRARSIRRKYLQIRASYPSFKRLKERMNMVKELVKTEETYVTNLNLLNDFYIKPIKDTIDLPHETPLISEQELRTVFQTNVLGQIIKLNSELLTSLQKEYAKWPLDCQITKVVMEISPYLRLYTPYYINSGPAGDLLRRKMKESQALADFSEGQRSKTNKLDVFDFLILPVQRIPRYVLFFKGMLKQTVENTKIHEDLKKSLNLLESITNHVNIEKRYSMFTRQTSKRFHIFDEIMLPHRKFHFSEEKAKVRAFIKGEKYVSGTYDLQLYNDLLLWYNASLKKLVGTVYLVFSELKSIDANTFELSLANYEKVEESSDDSVKEESEGEEEEEKEASKSKPNNNSKVKEVNVRYEFRINDVMDKRKFEKVIATLIKDNGERVKKKGILDPPSMVSVRNRILKEIVRTDRMCQKQKNVVNETYEKLQVVTERVEKEEMENIKRMKAEQEKAKAEKIGKKGKKPKKGSKKNEKGSDGGGGQLQKTLATGRTLERKPSRFGRFFGGIFGGGKGKKGKNKGGEVQQVHDNEQTPPLEKGPVQKVLSEEEKVHKKFQNTLQRKQILEIQLKREYEKKKIFEGHQKDLKYKLKTCQRQLATCMGDMRYSKVFPDPKTAEDIKLVAAKKDQKFLALLVPVAESEEIVKDLKFITSKCWPDMDEDFDDEEVISQYDFDELLKVEYPFDDTSDEEKEDEDEGENDD